MSLFTIICKKSKNNRNIRLSLNFNVILLFNVCRLTSEHIKLIEIIVSNIFIDINIRMYWTSSHIDKLEHSKIGCTEVNMWDRVIERNSYMVCLVYRQSFNAKVIIYV